MAPRVGRDGRRHRAQTERRRELSREERGLRDIAAKFCPSLLGSTRIELRGVEHQWLHEWITVRMTEQLIADDGGDYDQGSAWRRVRDKLEAVTILGELASMESYSWRRHRQFWLQFQEVHDPAECSSRRMEACISTEMIPAVRDDTTLPRFLLDFSFATVTNDTVTLLRHALLGSSKSMRVNFLNAMTSLEHIHRRRRRAVSISLALRFARCQFAAADTVTRIVDTVQAVNDCLRLRQRELSNSTSNAIYFHIVELDIGGIDLPPRDLLYLRRVSRCQQLKLVLHRAIMPSVNTALAFGALVESWFPGSSRRLHDGVISGVRELSLDSNVLSLPHIASLFSGIHGCGPYGVRSLSLRGALQSSDPRAVWVWIGYALFAVDVCTSVESVNLSNNLIRMVDAAAVASVMEAEASHRLERVCAFASSLVANAALPVGRPTRHRRRHRSAAAACGGSWIRIQAGTRVWLPYPSVIDSGAFVLTDTAIGQVIHQAQGVVVAVVPAYGVLSVDVSNVTPMNENKPQAYSSSHNNLRALRMNSMTVPETERADNLFAALFKSLRLSALSVLELNGNALGSTSLQAILTACPQLQALHLEACEVASLQPLLRSYSDGVCHIEHLHLAENQIGGHDVAQLCRLMMDSSCPASHIRILNLDQNPIGGRGLQALSTVLRERRSLLELVVSRSEDPDLQFRRSLYLYEHQFMGVCVLSESHRIELDAALAKCFIREALDPSIVERICRFAGSVCHRRVIWR